MKKCLFLFLLFATPAFAGQQFTYEVFPKGHFILRLPDHAMIPKDPMNLDYQAYRKWLRSGHKPKTHTTKEK